MYKIILLLTGIFIQIHAMEQVRGLCAISGIITLNNRFNKIHDLQAQDAIYARLLEAAQKYRDKKPVENLTFHIEDRFYAAHMVKTKKGHEFAICTGHLTSKKLIQAPVNLESTFKTLPNDERKENMLKCEYAIPFYTFLDYDASLWMVSKEQLTTFKTEKEKKTLEVFAEMHPISTGASIKKYKNQMITSGLITVALATWVLYDLCNKIYNFALQDEYHQEF